MDDNLYEPNYELKIDILSDKQMIKQNMVPKLAKSNIILIGNPRHNGFIQAMKPDLVKKAKEAGVPWQEVMNKPGLHGAYGMEHPYNKDRLIVHYFWTDDHLNKKTVKSRWSEIGAKILLHEGIEFLLPHSAIQFINDKWTSFIIQGKGFVR